MNRKYTKMSRTLNENNPITPHMPAGCVSLRFAASVTVSVFHYFSICKLLVSATTFTYFSEEYVALRYNNINTEQTVPKSVYYNAYLLTNLLLWKRPGNKNVVCNIPLQCRLQHSACLNRRIVMGVIFARRFGFNAMNIVYFTSLQSWSIKLTNNIPPVI